MSSPGTAEREIKLSHGRSRYLEAGEGPPVVLLHGVGFVEGRDNWRLNIGPLSSRFRVLAPDLLGWGAGDQLNVGYSFAYLVDFVREFQDALDIRSSHVVGHSMGGWIASLLAYESPQRVDKLVLVASGGLATRPLSTMTTWQPPTEDFIRERLEKVSKAHPDPERAIRERLGLAQDPERTARFGRIMEHMSNPETRQRYNTTRRLPFISSPTLVVWGRQDEVNPLPMGEDTQRLIPNSRLEILEDCGHSIPVERADEFNRIVLDFLSE
ncbi:MAG: alpha/beta fold hydrolase [Streptosporangiales bacterium]|nr:alpha/beta fold hydrolase [Streptosporangiales bacterium]